MAKKRTLELVDGIRLRILAREIDGAIGRYTAQLEQLLSDPQAPVSGDRVLALIAAIEKMQTKIIAADDPAGRGFGAPDEEDDA